MEWTDDLSVRLARGTTFVELVRYINDAKETGKPWREVLGVLTSRFALSFDDARLAVDRVGGGAVRALSANPANEPDQTKDPVAWTSYQLNSGRVVKEEAIGLSKKQLREVERLLKGARSEEPTAGTNDVAVALEVSRIAASSVEDDRVRYFLLMEAATCVSSAYRALVARLNGAPCATGGTQEWVDGVQLAGAARNITATFAAQPDPELEGRGLELVRGIVTFVLGQCRAFVGPAMLDVAHWNLRNGDVETAVGCVEAVVADFEILLEWIDDDGPVDEDVIGLEYLLAAIDLLDENKGSDSERSALRVRVVSALARGAIG
jgi:hypothetical protein